MSFQNAKPFEKKFGLPKIYGIISELDLKSSSQVQHVYSKARCLKFIIFYLILLVKVF